MFVEQVIALGIQGVSVVRVQSKFTYFIDT